MSQIIPTVQHILGKKEFIYEAELINDQTTEYQGPIDISRLKGGVIRVSGLSSDGIGKIHVLGTTDRTIGTAMFTTIPVVNAAATASVNDIELFGNAGSSIGVASNGISISAGYTTQAQAFLKVPDGIAQIKIRIDGASLSKYSVGGTSQDSLSCKFFGKSY